MPTWGRITTAWLTTSWMYGDHFLELPGNPTPADPEPSEALRAEAGQQIEYFVVAINAVVLLLVLALCAYRRASFKDKEDLSDQCRREEETTQKARESKQLRAKDTTELEAVHRLTNRAIEEALQELHEEAQEEAREEHARQARHEPDSDTEEEAAREDTRAAEQKKGETALQRAQGGEDVHENVRGEPASKAIEVAMDRITAKPMLTATEATRAGEVTVCCHALRKLGRTPGRPWFCNNCNFRSVQCRTMARFRCEICKYDLCADCWDAFFEALVQQHAEPELTTRFPPPRAED